MAKVKIEMPDAFLNQIAGMGNALDTAIPKALAAGGKVVNWRGAAPDDKGQILAVGDARLIDQALVTLKRAAA